MTSRFLDKAVVILILFLLLLMNFLGMSFSDLHGVTRSSEIQPNNSFKKYIWGGVSDQKDAGYGWNLTYIENFNGDEYIDLMIGAPMYDFAPQTDDGAVFIFYGSMNNNFKNINYSNADIIIHGDESSHHFGWDVSDAGDMNNDGLNELIVGSPGALNDQGQAYIFYGGSLPSGMYSASASADRILNGPTGNGGYGKAVSGIGDVDDDGYDDVVVGAPNLDKTVISYGYENLIKIYPNIWDDNLNTPGVVDFSNGANNTVNDTNTWGRLAGDDGWDWTDAINDTIDRVYGHHVTTPAHGTTIDLADCYGPWESDGPDGDNKTLLNDNRTALEVIAGRTHGTSNPYGPSGSNDPMTSAAWGIEFNITSEMMDYISSNSSVIVTFNYESWDNEKVFNTNPSAGTEELCTVRSRIWNSSGKYYIGDVIKNDERYIFYHYQEFGTPEWATVSGSFKWDITEFIDDAGTYYWDFGCSFGYPDISQSNNDPDEGILTYFDDVSMVITNNRQVILEGARSSDFGSALLGPGDIDGDNTPDILIGAPNLDTGHMVLLHGKKRFRNVESMNLATMVLTGRDDGDLFGYSIASAGDVDNDGIQDIIVGAPGGNYANLYYGSTLNTPPLLPDLWENDTEKDTPQIEFNSGLKTIDNTPGLDGEDDGWDVCDGYYGSSSGNPGSSVKYNGADTPNPTQVAEDDKLLIQIGAHFGNDAKPDSGAYGVEFSVTQEMMTSINNGGEVVISYDWNFENLELEPDETIWMKTFLRNPSTDYDLGWDLDELGSSNNKDQTKEIYWSDSPEDMHDVFIQKCTNCFINSGDYYLDVGAKIRGWTNNPTNVEDGIFHIDNIYLRINPAPDAQYIGPVDSGFGYSVGFSDKLNFDDYGDIVIGAPYYDSPNGEDTGAIFGFFSNHNMKKQILAEHAEFITYGEQENDKFGWVITGELSLDSDEYSEVITSSPGYDSTATNIGKVYVLSITKKPIIRLIYPIDGEFITGNVTVNATMIDPDNNFDSSYGVRFYFSTNLQNWTQIGIDGTLTPSLNIFDHYWNTTFVSDGTNYYVKAVGRDSELNIGENISSRIMIDNPHPPKINMINPKMGETIDGLVEIRALVMDSELDTIGGGIDKNEGVKFYFSKDLVTWEFLGEDKKDENNVYSIILDTQHYFDGEYWLRVNGSDLDGFNSSKMINITIDNPSRPPSIELLEPLNNEELSGFTTITATAIDYDNDINASGISFYITLAIEEDQWQFIGNNSSPTINDTGTPIYSFDWNTRELSDNWYGLKAVVQDNTNLSNQSSSHEVRIHNNKDNPPVIEIVTPECGEMLKETQMIRVFVRDLENNIDEHGVDYYYSEDKVKWRYIGASNNPEITGSDYYTYLWRTDTVPDGEYWLNVTVVDTTGFRSWDVLDCTIFIHNSDNNPPIVKITSPIRGQHINGTFTIQAFALDLENNIDANGVLFMYSRDGEDWSVISYTPTPNQQKGNIYEYSWDTTQHPDGRYWLRAEASDFDTLKGIGISEYFFIHNSEDNLPVVDLLHPKSGELSGQVKINATVFDLENNVNENGVTFYYSIDNATWKLIDSDWSGAPAEEEKRLFEITWDTTIVPDDYYWVKAEAEDLTNLVGFDISDRLIVHNKQANPPRIELLQPKMGIPLDPIQSIIVNVIDFDNDLESVAFLFSSDNLTWELIDSRLKPEIGSTYKTIWNTEEIYNGKYYIKIVAKDKMGNQEELTAGLFEVTHGKVSGGSGEGGFFASNLTWIGIVVVVIVIMILLIVLLLRRSKQREKELIEEVSTELRSKQGPENEIELEPKSDFMKRTELGLESDIEETIQTIVPASEAPSGTSALEPAPGVPGIIPELPQTDEMLPQLPSGSKESPQIQESESEPERLDEELEVTLPPEEETPPEVELPPDIDLPPDTEQPTITEEPTVTTPEVAPETQVQEQEQTTTQEPTVKPKSDEESYD
jgi:hypothetical protein